MNGLDTNILLRFFVPDDPRQSKAAAEYLERRCTPESPGFVNVIVLCELVWTLIKAYRFSRAEIAKLVAGMLDNAALAMEAREEVVSALQKFGNGGLDFPDLLIGEINRAHGCDATITFDRKAARLEGFRLLS